MHAGRIDANVLVEMTKEIVVAEITHNPVAPDAVPGLIERVYETLLAISVTAPAERRSGRGDEPAGDGMPGVRAAATTRPTGTPVSVASPNDPAARFDAAAPRPAVEGPRGSTAREDGREPAVPREKSVHADFIVCLFDGVKRKMLKRHIKTRYGMSPEAYRHYWELAEDYPMTAPNYANEKRDYALSTGFGLSRTRAARRGAA